MEQSLLEFAGRILARSGSKQAVRVLGQLKEMLTLQGDTEGAELIAQIILLKDDLSKPSETTGLTPQDLSIAKIRRAERLRREEMARNMGRC